MRSSLQTIINLKKQDIKQQLPSSFIRLFKKKLVIIGEVKFASPTEKKLLARNKLKEKISSYIQAKVDAISLITEKHVFHGDISDMLEVKKLTTIPVLQKDFIVDVQQIIEAKEAGSDALLLIAQIVDAKTLMMFVSVCLSCGIEPIVEINTTYDLKKAIKTRTRIIAVNARNLKTFRVDVKKACRLLQKIPVGYVKLGFSGIVGRKEAALYRKAHADGILIGTALMKEVNVDAFLSSLT